MMKTNLTLLFCFCSIIGFSQQAVLKKEVDKQGILKFMVFDVKSLSISLGQAKKLLHDSLKFRSNDAIVLLQETKDSYGFTHQSYQQYYNGILVEHGVYGVTARNGNIEYIDGEFKNVKEVITTPSLTENDALQIALNYVNANKYMWENPNEEKFIKSIRNNPNATFYPKSELLICRDELKTDSIYRLAYKFDIYAQSPSSHKVYYIDAITGEILKVSDLIFDSNSLGTAATRYSGTQTITTDQYISGFRLRELRNGVRIETYNMNRDTLYSNTDFSDNDNNWTAAEYHNSNFDDAALDAHWGLEKVYDYWKAAPRNRNSLDNAALPLLNYVHGNLIAFKHGPGTNDNAFWDNSLLVMTYGDGQTIFNPLTCLDVIAHETGHGIMHWTGQFGNNGENGALGEGFSDIWGAVIEHWAVPYSINQWLIGDQIIKNGALCLRSLRSPKTEGYNQLTGNLHGGYPDTYQHINWDNRLYPDPHINSTVLSHWFYLLSQGGSGTNDLGNSYVVLGLGIDSAASIVWYTESQILTNHHTAIYPDVKDYTIQAAINMSNGNSNSIRVSQVKNAWYAVGLGTQPTQMSISGPWLLCSSGASYTIINPVVGALTWQMSSNISYVSGTNPAIFRANGYGNSSGWIQAYYDGLPGPIINVWSGTFESTPVTGQSGVCPNSIYNYTAQVPGGYSSSYSFSWTYPSNWMKNFQYQNTVTLQTPMYNPAYGAVRVSITNQCGTSGYSGLTVYPGSCPHYFTIYPNPASNDITITMIDNSTYSTNVDTVIANVNSNISTLDVPINFTIRIYNSQSTLISSVKRSGTSFSVPLTNMRDGTYIVEVTDGKTSKTQTLIVKHN